LKGFDGFHVEDGCLKAQNVIALGYEIARFGYFKRRCRTMSDQIGANLFQLLRDDTELQLAIGIVFVAVFFELDVFDVIPL